MKIIKEFADFKWNITPITLTPGGIEIYFDSDKVKQLRAIIRDYLLTIPELDRNIYGPVRNISISGKIVNTEYLAKMPNNIAILYVIYNIAKRLGHIIDNADDFIFWVNNNLKDLFNPSGKYFDQIYSRLNKANDLGKIKELAANEFFTIYAKEIGLDVTLLAPSTDEDALGGIDYYFLHNGKKVTIQVKTLNSISKGLFNKELSYLVKIDGDFTDIKTDYLILMSKSKFYPSYIFRNVKDNKKIFIDTEFSRYIIPDKNLVVKKNI